MGNALITAISFIVIFGLIVFVHESGHFITAKLSGIKVHEFALGMGPAVFRKQKGETLYALRALPIGGYVRMEGEDGASDDPRSFAAKKPWQRLLVLAAGPVMNFVLGYILLVLVMFFGWGEPTTTIDVIENLPAYEAGFQSGDTIRAIDGTPVETWDEVIARISSSNGQPVEVTVDRGGEALQLSVAAQKNANGDFQIGVKTRLKKQFGASFARAGEKFHEFFMSIFVFIAHLGQGSGADVVGPVGLVVAVGQTAQQGLLMLVFLAAYISINLGIFNILPFPALDGGRMVFVLIEMVIGHPIDREKEGFVHFLGFAVLMVLMVFLVFRDVSRL